MTHSADYGRAFMVVREAVRGRCRSDIGEVTLAAQIVDALVAAEIVAPGEVTPHPLGAYPPSVVWGPVEPELNDEEPRVD